ncbi:OLC1v1027881C1 [Oldenlandia corymbosa var. corymbosa]|uniref:OLC1v1027881C1 n=1 Tax=Oldenlandia corymbosa var. corymbosa TaxID=529605 RepID=A0AAV1CDK8_OLDCO|nr:OLC1v1027881C1 [Oldenlandia corymbosa var. corymbosa]
MLTVQILGVNNNFQAYLDSHQLNEHPSRTPRVINPLSSSVCAANSALGPFTRVLQSSSFSWDCFTHLKPHHLSQQSTTKRWMCRSKDTVSPDDEFRSSRNIAISLFRRYRSFVERGGGDNLKEFISAGVHAYALGCTDEGLRTELTQLKDSGADIEALQGYGGTTSLKYKIFNKEVDECILWLSIIFITILCTPQPTVVRWSSTPPVSEEIMLQWKGFCAIIANAYYVRGMAWLPVKTLQLEQMAVVGYAEEPSLVASRMQLVFSTLEVVSPQWPRG